MNLKDYIHLYMGCKIQLFAAPMITSLSDGKYVIRDLTQPVLGYATNEALEPKPILRRLQHATRDEILEILFHIHDDKVHLDKDSRISREEIANCIDLIEPDDNAVVVHFSIRCFSGKLYMSQHSGQMSLYDEEDTPQSFDFRPELYRFLLSRYFDIFSLIDAGLALDEGTMFLDEYYQPFVFKYN